MIDCRKEYFMFFEIIFLLTISFELLNDKNDFIIVENDEVVQTINRDDYHMLYLDEPFINRSKVIELLDELKDNTYKQPVDATINDDDEIVKEITGYKLDKRQFLIDFYASFYNERVKGFK